MCTCHGRFPIPRELEDNGWLKELLSPVHALEGKD